MVGRHIHIIPQSQLYPRGPAAWSRIGWAETSRKRTLANLSKLPMDAVDAIRRILKGEKLVSG